MFNALIGIQMDYPVIERTEEGQVGPRKYMYAALKEIVEKVRPILKAAGLVVVQLPTTSDRGLPMLTTRLQHKSGQWIEGDMDLLSPGTSQSMGSAITYGRRYALCAMLGIVTEGDDDGDANTGRDDVALLKTQLNRYSANPEARKAFVVEALGLFGPEDLGSFEELTSEQVKIILKALVERDRDPAS